MQILEPAKIDVTGDTARHVDDLHALSLPEAESLLTELARVFSLADATTRVNR